jgi:uncharacterized protein with PIN domain
MVLDMSALMVILAVEPEANMFAVAIASADQRLLLAASLHLLHNAKRPFRQD